MLNNGGSGWVSLGFAKICLKFDFNLRKSSCHSLNEFLVIILNSFLAQNIHSKINTNLSRLPCKAIKAKAMIYVKGKPFQQRGSV